MKKYHYLFLGLLALCAYTAKAQGPTKILFIGNSFTAANDLAGVVGQLFTAGGKPAITQSYAPGGISVGDVAMGASAHMNNPEVFDLIRRDDWDYVVLQDNQGRFALDSAVFPNPAASKVVEGHLKIRDSVHYYHPCAKMIWFSGWGFQDEDITMIDQITVNYRVLNDSAKDVIAPIGPAWKESILMRPAFNLWSADGAHPDVTGTFLTGVVIYGTITGRDVVLNPYNHTLPPPDADYLKSIAQKTLTDPTVRLKSNLRGIMPLDINWDGTLLKSLGGYERYRWYKDNKLVHSSPAPDFAPAASGNYVVWAEDLEGNWQKSCAAAVTITTGIDDPAKKADQAFIYPNPATSLLSITNIGTYVRSIELCAVTGQRLLQVNTSTASMQLDLSALAPGLYFVRLLDEHNTQVQPAIKLSKQ